MVWNLYFLIMALIIQAVLLWFYDYRRNLPLAKNLIFKRLLMFIVLNGAINFVVAYLETRISIVNVSFLYFLNSIYFVLYEYIFYLIFLYGIAYFGKWKRLKDRKLYILIPLALINILSLSSKWTHIIFYYGVHGEFQRGPLFGLLNVFPFVYSMMLLHYRKHTLIKHSKRERVSLMVALLITLSGIFFNYMFKHVLLMEAFMCIAVLIMYINMENPEFYISNAIGTFNTDAFLCLYDEYIRNRTTFYVSGIKILNYESLRTYYGAHNLYECMKLLGMWLQEQIQDGYVFYTDNECFMIISTNIQDTEQLSIDLKKRLEDPFTSNEVEAYFRARTFMIKDPMLFKKAENCLKGITYAVKSRSIYESDVFVIDDRSIKQLKKMDLIHKILQTKMKQHDIAVYLQPIYSTVSKKIEGAEALVRLEDEVYGTIYPNDFIPLAEMSGEILELGLIIFETVCKYVKTHDLKNMGIEFISVNLSPVQFQDINLIESLHEIAMKYEVDFSIFDFEITETFVEQEQLVEAQLKRFRQFGASLSLDDFGKGSSNLERLVKYPFSIAKLDLSLVWNYFNGTNKIMEDVIHIFKEEELKIVAEGVEDVTMVEGLTYLNCNYLQGYYFSKALSMDEFDQFISKFNGVRIEEMLV